MRKEVLEKFFKGRGINIPDLDPRQWAQGLDVGQPVAAHFFYDFGSGRTHYLSGSGRTHLSWREEGEGWVDVRLHHPETELWAGGPEAAGLVDLHDWKVLHEFRSAGADWVDLAGLLGLRRISISDDEIAKGYAKYLASL